MDFEYSKSDTRSSCSEQSPLFRKMALSFTKHHKTIFLNYAMTGSHRIMTKKLLRWFRSSVIRTSDLPIVLDSRTSRFLGLDFREWNHVFCTKRRSTKAMSFFSITFTVFKIHSHTFQNTRLGRSCALATLQPSAFLLTAHLAPMRRRISF